MSEVILYLRESEGAPPLPDQRSACLDWIDDRGSDLYGVILERGFVSAPLRERPKLLRLLMDLERGQTLLFYSRDSLELDELSLSLIELEARRAQCVIRSVTEPDLKRLVATERHEELTRIINHYRTHLVGGKIRASLQERLAQGLCAGNVKLGERADEHGVLSPNDQELEAVALVQSLRADGLSVYEVEALLADLGIRCRSGRVPSIPTISRWTYYSRDASPRKAKRKLEEYVPHLGDEIRRLRDEGRTFKQICADLAALGYLSRNGKPFMPNQVRRVYLRVKDLPQRAPELSPPAQTQPQLLTPRLAPRLSVDPDPRRAPEGEESGWGLEVY